MRPRVFLDPEVGRILRRVFEPNDRLECQGLRRGREVDQCQAIAEHVVDPPDLRRTGRYLQSALQQTLIKAVPRPEHELMRAWPHRLPVPVRRGVMNGEIWHGGRSNPKHAINAAIAQREPGEAGPCCHFSTSGAGSKQQFMRRENVLAQCLHNNEQNVVGTY